MCGIVGCKLKRPLYDRDLEKMRHIRDSMNYRGPDDYGEYYILQEGLYLGHRRLSIIDPDARSAQPMHNGEYSVIYNGEIYNYLELQARLGKQYNFKTKSDTEVLLKAWEAWGPEAMSHFDGMYAFCLKDNKNSLHLVNDIFGEKPLYIYEAKDGYYFSSEAAPLIKQFNLNFNDESAMSDYTYLGFIRPPKSGYKNLITLPPASHYVITTEGSLVRGTHWHAGPRGKNNVSGISDNLVNSLRDILCESLEKRLRSDVPMGLFLSGGVDSTLVAALASRELGVDLNAYSVSFPDGEDESEYASKIANHFNLSHVIINSLENNSEQDAPKALVDIYGLPNDNMTGIAVYQMCKLAKPHITVALSGLGGDELFLGYNKYQFLHDKRWLYQFSCIAKYFENAPSKTVRTLADYIKGGQDRQYLRLKNGNALNVLEQTNILMPQDLLKREKSLAQSVNNFDLFYTMPQSQIPAIERASMRASMEIRTPYLNKNLFNFIWSLDHNMVIRKGQKTLLKALLARYIDMDLLYPSKQGFVFPQHRYLEQEKAHFASPQHISNENFQSLIQPDSPFYNPRLAIRILVLEKAIASS